MGEPVRPDGVPDDAEWNADENEWELGPKNAKDQPTGNWIWWDREGHLVCKASYDDHGELHGLLERWHPNGERAQWAPWVHGKTHGVQVWTLATDGVSDKHSRFPPNVPDDTMRMDMPYYHGGAQPFHFTLFRESGRELELPVDENGRVENLTSLLEHILPETTLLRVDEGTAVNGVALTEDPDRATRWIYDGPSEDHWRIKQWDDSPMSPYTWVVDTATFNRCFTLSTNAFVWWIESHRPDSVPNGATYDQHKKLWWVGEEDGGRVGVWTSQGEDGQPRGFQTYGEPGVLHGPARELYPDGSTQTEGQHHHGARCGLWKYYRHESAPFKLFPSDHDDVWRVDVEFSTQGKLLFQQYYRRDGTPCDQSGADLVPIVDDPALLGPVDGRLKRELDPGSDRARHIEEALRQWEELFGVPPHRDVQDILTFVLATQQRGYAWHWRAFVDGSRGITRGNTFANVVGQLQRWHRDTACVDCFCGTLSIGRQTGANKQYLLGFVESMLGTADRPPVYLYDEDGLSLEGPFALDVDRLVALDLGGKAFADRALSGEGLTKLLANLSGEVATRGDWHSLAERFAPSDFEFFAPERSLALDLGRRSRWILELLRGGDGDVAELFAQDDTDLTDPLYAAENAARHVPIGLYVMWRRFFFEEEDELAPVLEAAKDSDSRILRDAAELLEEVMYGREDLGKIDDIHEVRDNFLELELSYSPN